MNKIKKEVVEGWARKIKEELEEVGHICDYTIRDCLFWMFRELGMWNKSGK